MLLHPVAANPQPTRRTAALAAELEALVARRDRFADADHLLVAAWRELHDPQASDVDTVRLAAFAFQAQVFRRPDQPAMARPVRILEALLAQALPAALKLALGMPLASYHFWLGRGARTRVILESLAAAQRAPGLPPRLLVALQLTRAFCSACADDDGPSCMREAQAGLRLAADHGWHDLDGRLHSMVAYGALTTGDACSARAALDAVFAHNDPPRAWDEANARFMSSWLANLRGDIALAIEQGEAGIVAAQHAGCPFPEAMSRLYLAAARLANGELPRAADLAAQADEVARRIGSPGMLFACGLLRAAAWQLMGLERDAVETLAACLRLGKQHALQKVRVLPAPIVAGLLQLARRHAIEPAYVARLALPAAPAPTTLATPAPAVVPRLRVLTLGAFVVERDGSALRFGPKVPARALALLQAIIAHGGHEVPVATLADAVWPELDGDAAQAAFKVTLHRLRQLLGDDAVLRLRARRLTLDDARCAVDVRQVERALDQAAGAQRAGDAALAARYREAARALWRGPFLDGEDSPWVSAARARLAGLARALDS